MGCGCGKNKLGNRSNTRSGLSPRQNTNPTLTANNNAQTRNSGRAPSPNQKLNKSSVSAEQRKVQQLRRNAILKNMGRIK